MIGVCKIHVFHSWSKDDPPNVEREGENENMIDIEEKNDMVVYLDDNETMSDMGENAYVSGDNINTEGTKKGNEVEGYKGRYAGA